jgi:hypothetical protein
VASNDAEALSFGKLRVAGESRDGVFRANPGTETQLNQAAALPSQE